MHTERYVVIHISTCEMEKERIKNEKFTNEAEQREVTGAREKEKRKRK